MKYIILVGFIGLVVSHPSYVPVSTNYHGDIGIKEAARIKAAEEAIDFDGSRITGGSAASLGQYPFLGGLVITLTGGITSVCGSSLLTNTRAVTAAHCWYDGTWQAVLFEVVFGSLTLFTGGTRIPSSNVVMHEHWDPSWIRNDIAIIHLTPVTFSDTISPIAIASGHDQYVDDWAWAAGFGKQGDYSPISPNQVMHHVRQQVLPNERCFASYGSFVTDGNICTDGRFLLATCSGDSGGPLALLDDHTPTLIGITSFGSSAGCEWAFPSAFVRVTYYHDWIVDHL